MSEKVGNPCSMWRCAHTKIQVLRHGRETIKIIIETLTMSEDPRVDF